MTISSENEKTDTSKTAETVKNTVKSPADDVVPHPVLELPVEEDAYAGSKGLDWIVFGVTQHGDDFVIAVEKGPAAD